MIKIIVLVTLLIVFLVIAYSLNKVANNESEKADPYLTPQQKNDYEFYKNWTLTHTENIVTKEEFLEGKYT